MGLALVVRGGWPGHEPVAATELFLPGLRAAGFDITVSDTLSVYADEAALRRFDLIVQCWTTGELTDDECAGLVGAVRSGVGFAGWHGGILAAFGNRDYLRMVGGQFLQHPADFLDYDVRITDHAHPVVAGLDDFTVYTEQYWMITDAWNHVLAATTVHPGPNDEFTEPVAMPVVWTRRWGAGRVFCSAIGHRLADLTQPEVLTLTERGLRWASR